MIVMAVHEFAAKRRNDQDAMEKELYPEVSESLQHYPGTNWQAPLLAEVTRLYIDTYHREGGTGRPAGVEGFVRDVRDTLDKTENPTAATADRLSVWLATAILNAATQEAAAQDSEFLLMEWVTMHDSDVRPAHKDAEGQQRPTTEPYDVGGVEMRYPGDPTAPIELWINCRCTLAPVLASGGQFRENEGVTMTATETETEQVLGEPLAWHGVLAPEGEWSGDGRQFAPDSLRFRDLPLPLTWQKATDVGHDGSVVVGSIDSIERRDGMMHGSGVFLQTPEADEVVGLLAHFGKFGVSVDADDAEFEFNESDERITFTSARIASASIVAIPAFAQAYITLGPDGPPMQKDTAEEDPCDENSPAYDPEACAEKQAAEDGQDSHPMYHSVSTDKFISEKPWDGSAGRFTPEQWKSSCVLHVCDGEEKSCHKLPIKEPGGALSRAGVHAAASRFGQVDAPPEAKAKAASALRGAYSQLGEEPPDSIKAAAEPETFGRGPGWVTNPEDTRRIHDYWTKPGEEGFVKINWGVPGDFNRCRVEVGQEIAENSPEKTRFLNQICAQWHYDALGYWPGRPTSGDTVSFTTNTADQIQWSGMLTTTTAPSITLTAGATKKAPAAWFKNPELSGVTHLTVTEDGRVFGHIAEWKACHIGYEGVCVAPPNSPSGYAYYATGQVLLDDGTVAKTGVISLGAGHARDGLRPQAAIEHYDSTSAAVADVCVGEDEHGIWCAGWIRPGTTEEQVIALRASDVSGDWREVRGELELVAALAVNVGGFSTVSVSVSDGVQVSLVAAGMVLDESSEAATEAFIDQIEKRLSDRADRRARMRAIHGRFNKDRMTELAARVRKEMDGGTL